jgi:thioesterase domain-containing protein
VAALSEDYGATVGAADLALAPTVAGLAERIQWPRSSLSACAALRSGGDLPPLFCVTGGGGLAVGFVPLVRHLHPDRPVYGLQNPAMLGNGLPDWSVRALARRYLKEVRKVQPEGPYFLAGHSFGGMVAFEMSQQLERVGQKVALLVLIDTLRFSVGDTVRDAAFSGSGAPIRSSRSYARRLLRSAKMVWRTSRAGFRPEPGSSQYWLFFEHSRTLLQRYKPRPWGGQTVVFVAKGSEESGDAFDWTGLLTGPSETRYCPGEHLTIYREPYAQGFASELEDVLQHHQEIAASKRETM